MFSKRKNSGIQNARFYQLAENVEEVQSGFLYKSPPQTLFRSLKSWKRRYFVLSKTTTNHYELKFFKEENKREKPLGQINLYQVTLLFRNAESHQIWLWIQRNFRCSVSCVLYMKASEREYFLIGENSCEINDWFDAIFNALNTHLTTVPGPEEIIKSRSQSEPASMLYHEQKWSEDQEQEDTDLKASPLLMRLSAPESFNSQYSHYDYPKNYMVAAAQSLESGDTEEDEEDEMSKESETEEDSSCYMDMESVRDVLRQTQNDVIFPQTNLEGNNVSESSSFQTGNEDVGSSVLNRRVPSDSETLVAVKKEICVSQDELRNSVIISEEAGRLRVSNWKHMQASGLFHEGDQILAINDLLTDSLLELQGYLKRLSKNHVKLTVLRQPGSQPLSGHCT